MIDDIRHIRAFLTAARIGNFTRAAQALHLSQSAFTVQIKQLEEALGVTLFDRGKRGASLTPAGREILVPLERILVDVESIVSRTRQLSDLRRGLVAVAVLPSVAVQLFPEIIGRFTRQYPGIIVKIQDVVAERLIDAVKKESVDFGVGSPMQVDRELAYKLLMTDRLCAFMPKNHKLAQQDVVLLEQLAQLPLILTGRDSSVREVLENALKKARLIPRIAFETNYMATAISMAKAGLGIAVLPESASTVDSSPTLRSIPIGKPSLSRKIVLIQRKERSLSPAAAKMVETIFEIVVSRRESHQKLV